MDDIKRFEDIGWHDNDGYDWLRQAMFHLVEGTIVAGGAAVKELSAQLLVFSLDLLREVEQYRKAQMN